MNIVNTKGLVVCFPVEKMLAILMIPVDYRLYCVWDQRLNHQADKNAQQLWSGRPTLSNIAMRMTGTALYFNHGFKS